MKDSIALRAWKFVCTSVVAGAVLSIFLTGSVLAGGPGVPCGEDINCSAGEYCDVEPTVGEVLVAGTCIPCSAINGHCVMCSGPEGTCTDCEVGYRVEGNTCVFDCPGVPECSDNGTCIGPDFCDCDLGWQGDACELDVDECADEGAGNNCDVNAMCNNEQGSFSCTCHFGYQGDGVTCTDIDECAATPNLCGPPEECGCNNILGAWECVDIDVCAGNPCDDYDGGATCNDVSLPCSGGPGTPDRLVSVGPYTCTCSAGFYDDLGTCQPCAPGFISDSGAAFCTPCAPGTFTIDGMTCQSCLAGTFSGSGAGSCTACDPGTFSSEGADSCQPCLAGTISGSGAASCTACLPGTFSSVGADSCQPCPAGTFSGPGVGSCTPCNPGTFSGSGAGSCTPCDPGSFSNVVGAASCTPCAPGTFSYQGANSCQPCDAACDGCEGPGPDLCASCATGYIDSYLVGAGGGGSASVGSAASAIMCVPCSTCEPPDEYKSAECTDLSDTVCLPCTECESDEFESANCSPTSDRVCTACDPACLACEGPTNDDCFGCAPGYGTPAPAPMSPVGGGAAALSPETCVAQPDHYQCYRTRTRGFEKVDVALVDQFGTIEAQAEKLEDICTPVKKNGEGNPNLNGGHLTCYKLSGVPKTPKRYVTVDNQFGTLDLQVKEPRELCLPATKDIGTAPMDDPAALNVNHFLCYKAGVASGASFDAQAVTLEDQFETRDALARRPVALCNPVDKNGEGTIVDPANHLVCYELNRQAALGLDGVFTSDQFGDLESRVFQAETLCVPSTKTVLPE